MFYFCNQITDNIILNTILKYIANVQTGIYAQTSLAGNVVYLQAKHFDENGSLLDSLVPELPLNSQTEKHLLNEGDVLFAAKGTKNFATKHEGKNGKCVASSTFLVLRLKEEFQNRILSDFLVWYMNHPKTQEWIKAKARGSSIPSISKEDLLELEITLPPLEKQKVIVKINNLQKTEQNLVKKIQLLKEQYIQHQLYKAINYEL
jgi:hypothetical protein